MAMSPQSRSMPESDHDGWAESLGGQHGEDSFEEEEDDDPGMFSYLPPSQSSPPIPLSHLRPFSGVSSPHPVHINLPTVPAASYPALTESTRSQYSYPPFPSPSPSTSPSPAPCSLRSESHEFDGPRRRGSWRYDQSPTTNNTSNPFDFENSRASDDATSIKTTATQLQSVERWESWHRSIGPNDKGSGGVGPENLDGYYEDEEDSPFPEVRASVSNIDDPEMPCLTFRVWLIGGLLSGLLGAVNLFFSFRYPAPQITPIVLSVIAYPVGKFLAATLPTRTFSVPGWLQKCGLGLGEECSLNPGPFNIKEHTVIIMMSNLSLAPSFSLHFNLANTKFYHQEDLGAGFDILLTLTANMTGFGLSGLCRRFLVWPASMIWPQNLVFCTLLNTLHAEEDDVEEGAGLSRYRFFLYASTAAFLWYFVPGYLFQALSAFSYICWAAPNSKVVNQLFGVGSGLGLGMLTFDWSQISYIGSPLVMPYWAEVNGIVGFVLIFWVVAPIMYYLNVWNTGYLPVIASDLFDRFGAPYNISEVTDTVSSALNVTAYQEYSPVYLPISYVCVYAMGFAIVTCVLVHTALYHGKDILSLFKRIAPEPEDVHAKLMRNYPEVPDWWYAGHLVVFTVLSIVVVAKWEVQTPVWVLLLAIALGAVYVLPGGYLYALTSQQITINLILEYVAGYLMPDQPLGNMIFKIYAAEVAVLAMNFVQDLKLGHYQKIPPRISFTAQIAACVFQSFFQVGVKRLLVSHVKDLCAPDQAARLTCATTQVFFSSSVVWGLIGPERQFGWGKMYHPIVWALLIGALLPIPFWLYTRKYPKSWVRYINTPVAITTASYVPPATGINYSSWFLVGTIFQFYLRRRYFRWWSKFNFVLSSALDSGTVFSGLVIFLALQLPKNGSIGLNWWGNTVFTQTADWEGVPYLTPPAEGFGRTTW